MATAVLAQSALAEGGGEAAIEAVSGWYGVQPDQVRDALDFETAWLKQAA